MEQTGFKVYGYRWVVLLAFMLVVVVNQLLWITFAPITSSTLPALHRWPEDGQRRSYGFELVLSAAEGKEG